MVNFENLLATLLYKIRPFGQASDRASDTFGHCSVFSFSWKSLKMEPKKEPKDPQTIHEDLLLLLSTHQALKLKLWHVLKMSTKAPLGFEGALPFGQASDNLRTLFALFKTVSGNWEGRCSRGSLGEHISCVKYLGIQFRRCLTVIATIVSKIVTNIFVGQKPAKSEAVGSSDGSLTEAKIISSHLS